MGNPDDVEMMPGVGRATRPVAIVNFLPHDRSAGRFAYEVVGGVPVVAAPEEIDVSSAPDLRAALLEAAERGRGTLVVDLTRTLFCDCSGLHTLLMAHKRAQSEGGELRLAMPAGVLRVFALTGLDRVIPSFASVDLALAHQPARELNSHQRRGGTRGRKPERAGHQRA